MGSWDSSVFVKPDFTDSGFTGTGDYKFKLGYYYLTSGGSSSSINWSSNDASINIGSLPISIPTPTKIKNGSTSMSSIIKTPTLTKQVSTSNVLNPAVSTIYDKNSEEFAKISHITKPASEYAQIKPISNIENKKEAKVLGISDTKTYAPILFISGISFLLAAVSPFIIKILKERNIL